MVIQICTPGSFDIVAHLTHNNPGTPYMDQSAKLIVEGFKAASGASTAESSDEATAAPASE